LPESIELRSLADLDNAYPHPESKGELCQPGEEFLRFPPMADPSRKLTGATGSWCSIAPRLRLFELALHFSAEQLDPGFSPKTSDTTSVSKLLNNNHLS